MLKLFEEIIQLLDVFPGSPGNSFLPVRVDQVGVGPLGRGHRVDQGLNALEGIVADVQVLDLTTHPRDHPQQVFHVPHLLDLFNLHLEISKVELILADFGFQFLSLGLIELRLCLLNE